MILSFIKMHGLGNDFAVFDCRNQDSSVFNVNNVSKLSDRKTGIGCDQLIVLTKSDKADVFMHIYNFDGGEVEACGNASRCVGKLLFEEIDKNIVYIETIVGILSVERSNDGFYTVNMGSPRWGWQDIPLSQEQDTLSLALPLPGVQQAVAVNVGNPHVVFFVDKVDSVPLEDWGPSVENNTLFPERTNVEFVEVLSRKELRMRVWERGTGVTRACGSGACAVLVAAVRAGKSSRKSDVILDGGVLSIHWDEESNDMFMTGTATEVYRGSLSLQNL